MSYVDVVRHIYILQSRTYTPAETYEYTVLRRTVISYVKSYFFGDIVYDIISPHRYITMSYVDVVRHIYILRSRTYTPAETYEYTVRRRTVISYVVLCCLPEAAALCSGSGCCHWQLERPSPWPAVPMGPASCSSALLNGLYSLDALTFSQVVI